jgi:hypothetical protein
MATETGLRSAADSVPLNWEAVRTYLAAHGLRLDTDPSRASSPAASPT